MKKFFLVLGIFFLFVISTNAQKTVEKALTVQASGYTWYDFNFNETTNLKGRFRASGGNRNDIEVYIMDADNFENWKNGNQARTYYNSGRVTVANFNVRLAEGNYYMVFNNRWSIMTPKAVTVWFY